MHAAELPHLAAIIEQGRGIGERGEGTVIFLISFCMIVWPF